MTYQKNRVVLAFTLLVASAMVSANDDLPWAFNAPRAEGYAIDLVAIEPAPGTPLVAGSTVEFKVTLQYSLSIATTGTIVLVFQDNKNRSAKPDGQQVVHPVSGPTGTVTLTDSVTILKRAKELLLFVPLVPQGVSNTTGEVTIRFPIVKQP